MRIGCFDQTSNSVSFYTESTEYGRSAALYLNSSPKELWVAGVTTMDENTSAWMFSLFKINMADGTAQTAFRFAPTSGY